MNCSLGLGLIFIAFAVLVAGSPYWLLNELQRSEDEKLPEWMGDARTRKRRLAWIVAVLSAVIGGGLIVLSYVNP